jgi:CheY-like chemotaxis protein
LASNEPSHGGTGLGLAITRQLVKALGGTVSVQSDYGHWCEFTFCLPCTSRNLEGNAAANVADIRRGSVESAYSDYSFSDSETCASMDTSNASYGGLSTTSFQKVVDAAARKQVANMAGTQILAPQLTSPNGSLEKGRVQLASPFSLAKSGSQTSFGVCSFGSQASFGLGCLSESQPCMNNKDFVFTRHMSAGSFGSVKKSASGGSFGKSRRAAASVSSQFSTSMMRNKPFAAIIPETSAPSLDSKTSAIPEASVAPKLDSNKQNTVVAAIIPEATLAPPPSTDSKSTLGSLRVLIAEDNKINQKVLKRTLLRLGIKEIDIVDDGKKAVETSKDKIFDIVFMDMQMPVMDGLEATSVISQRAEHPKIVFLTAHALSEYQEKAIEAGGDLFISKPFKLGVIRGILESLVQDAIDLSDS